MDIYTRDPNRLYRDTRLGNMQAWGAPADSVCVAMSLYATVDHAPSKQAYISQVLNLTAADARDLARALVEAADHADRVCTDGNPDATPKTFGSAEAMS